MLGERKLSDIPQEEAPIFHKGTLFAVVAGARLYQPSGQPFFYIDMIAGIDDLEYPELLEDIPLEKAHEDAKQRPDDAERARVFMRRSLNGSYNRAMRNDRHISLPIELRDPSGTAPDYPLSSIHSLCW